MCGEGHARGHWLQGEWEGLDGMGRRFKKNNKTSGHIRVPKERRSFTESYVLIEHPNKTSGNLPTRNLNIKKCKLILVRPLALHLE
jgi:hypothetical protein